jgi:hypothetical protein
VPAANNNDIKPVAHRLPSAIKPLAFAKPLSSQANPAHDGASNSVQDAYNQ